MRPFMMQNKESARWVWRWKKSMRARVIAFYIMGLSMKTMRNALFVDSADSIIEKMVVMTRTATKEKGPKKVFWYFPLIPYLKRWFANKKESELLRWHKEKYK
jgi:hypothetical protein